MGHVGRLNDGAGFSGGLIIWNAKRMIFVVRQIIQILENSRRFYRLVTLVVHDQIRSVENQMKYETVHSTVARFCSIS